MISGFEQALLAIMIAVIMFGMGCTLSLQDFKLALTNPKPFAIGFASQYFFMPIIAFTLAMTFQLPAPLAIGLIIMGCTPSGTTSSLFNYFARGDLALSISLSTVTTAAALVMMPVLLMVYGSPFTSEEVTIPAGKVIASLLVCLLPVLGGMYLRSRSLRWAKNMEETGAFCGIFIILFLILTWVPRNFGLLMETPWYIFFCSLMLGLGGFFFGYWASRLLRENKRRSRTVALETGIQNGPLALAIVTITFAGPRVSEFQYIPIFYSLFIVISSTVVTYYLRKHAAAEHAEYENRQVQDTLFAGAEVWPKVG